jgi:hypothetical protein
MRAVHYYLDEDIRPWEVRVEDLPKLSRDGRWSIEMDYLKQHVRHLLEKLKRATKSLWRRANTRQSPDAGT